MKWLINLLRRKPSVDKATAQIRRIIADLEGCSDYYMTRISEIDDLRYELKVQRKEATEELMLALDVAERLNSLIR